jgi:hypothetical protein
MTVLLLILAVALVAHEGTHWLVLRLAGAEPRSALRYPDRRLLLSLGLGWAFTLDHAEVGMVRLNWLCGPLAESAVWLGAACWALLTGQGMVAVACVVLCGAEFAGNWWLPWSDGRAWRAHRV